MILREWACVVVRVNDEEILWSASIVARCLSRSGASFFGGGVRHVFLRLSISARHVIHGLGKSISWPHRPSTLVMRRPVR